MFFSAQKKFSNKFFLFFITTFFTIPCLAVIGSTATFYDQDNEPKGHGLNFWGELLYWKTSIGNMPFAVTTTTPLFNPNQSDQALLDASYVQNAFCRDPGLKIGVQYELPCNRWDIGIIWTRFSQQASRLIRGTSNLVVAGVAFDQFGFIDIDTAMATSCSSYQVVDFVIGKRFDWDCYFTLHYYLGLKSARIKETMDIQYLGAVLDDAEEPVDSNIALFNGYSGTGIVSGFDAAWQLGRGFDIYGRGEFSVLQGKFLITDYQTVVPPGPTGSLMRYKNTLCSGAMNITTEVGLQWGRELCFCDHSANLAFYFGYELDFWAKQIVLARFIRPGLNVGLAVSSPNPNDIMFHGFNFGGSIQF